MATTTIRVDTETHARLVELSNASGATLVDTVRDAAEALRRQRFARQVAVELARLRQDSEAWTAYLADAESTSVTDGLG
jgi:predicted DNA-binding protein